MNIRKIVSFLMVFAIILGSFVAFPVQQAQAQNPYLPLWEKLPDGEPNVFRDPDDPTKLRAYVIGSHDQRGTSYCGPDIYMWSAPVDDLSNWRQEGAIFTFRPNNTGNWDNMYAPDIVEVRRFPEGYTRSPNGDDDHMRTVYDYYLYPHSNTGGRAWLVAKSVTGRPEGPYEPINVAANGTSALPGSNIGFDPGIFIDYIDDPTDQDYQVGFRAYAIYGWQSFWVHELVQENMWQTKTDSKLVQDYATKFPDAHVNGRFRYFLPVSSQYGVLRTSPADANPTPASIENYPFLHPDEDVVNAFGYFEAPEMRKVGNKYILTYSGYSGPDYGPLSTNSALRWAYGDTPVGPWKSGGVLVDSRGPVLNETGTSIVTSNSGHNTHGGLQQINDQWYVFYHRPPRGNGYHRQATVGPVEIEWDEKTVAEGGKVTIRASNHHAENGIWTAKTSSGMEYTGTEIRSDGFQVYGLDPYKYYSAGIVCYMTGGNATDRLRDSFDIWDNHMPLENVRNGERFGYKYFGFGGVDSTKAAKVGIKPFDGTKPGDNTKFSVWITPRTTQAFSIDVMLNGPWANATWNGVSLGTINVPADSPQVPTRFTIDVPQVESLTGMNGIYLLPTGPADTDLCHILGLGFSKDDLDIERPVMPEIGIQVNGTPVTIPTTPIRSTNANGLLGYWRYAISDPRPSGDVNITATCNDPDVKILVTQPSATSGLASAGLVRFIKDGVTKMYRLFHTFGTEADGEADDANVADILAVDALLSRPLKLSEVEDIMKGEGQSFGVNYEIVYNEANNTHSLVLSKGYTSMTLSPTMTVNATAIEKNGALSVAANIYSGPSAINATVRAAAYNSLTGQLIGVTSAPVTLPLMADGSVTLPSLDVSKADDYYVKVFLWDTTTMVPLLASQRITVDTDGMTQIAAFDFNEEPVDGAFYGAGAKAVIGGTPAYGVNDLDGTRSVSMNSSNQFYMHLLKEDGSPLLGGLKEFAISYDVLATSTSGEDNWVFYAARTTSAPKSNTYRWERYLGVKQSASNIEMRRWYNTGSGTRAGFHPPLDGVNNPTTAEWQQVYILFSNDKTDVYINGELVSSTPSEFSLPYIISELGGYAYIGRFRSGTLTNGQGNPPTYQYFTGQIDNFKVLVPAAPATDEGKVAAAKEALTLPYGITENRVRGNITLPEEGIWGTTITWSASHPDIVDTNKIEIENYDDRLPGVVTRPDADTVVTMTATIRSGAASDTKQFQFTVDKAPVLDEKEAYLFAHFTGEGGGDRDGEQVYFAVSQDLKTFNDLRPNRVPALESTIGDEGVRDMYLARSPEGDRFYLIATDLSVFRRGGWGANPQGPGLNMSSTCLAVWESDDLVNWSDMRLVDVAGNIPNAERAWAPEFVYDEATGDYFVFWATYSADMPPNKDGNPAPLMWYSRTRDFRTFTPAVSWILAPDGAKEIYDTTAILFDGNWFRASKECLSSVNNGDRTTIDMSLDRVTVGDKTYPSLTGAWDNEDNNFSLQTMFGGNAAFRSQYGAVEGPAFLRYNEHDWIGGQPTFALIVDRYSNGGGYTPFYTNDMRSKKSVADGGAWDVASSISMGPLTKRHGSIMPITQAEYDALLKAVSNEAPGFPYEYDDTVIEGMSKIADFDFNNLPDSGEADHIVDTTGNARAQFMSNVGTLGTDVSRSTELPPGESAGYAWDFPNNTTTAADRRWLNIQKSDGTALLLDNAGEVYEDIVVSFDLYRRTASNNSYPFVLDRDTTSKANINTGNYIALHWSSNGFIRAERIKGARLSERDYAWGRDPGFKASSTHTPVWFHVDLVIRPNSTGVYIDGKLHSRVDTTDDTFTLEDILGSTGGVMQLGKANLNSNQFFNGLIDNFQVYAK